MTGSAYSPGNASQPLDTELTQIAGVVPAAGDILQYDGSAWVKSRGLALIGSVTATDDTLTDLSVTGIPATYKDLVLVYRVRNAGAIVTNWQVRLQVGSGSFDTGSNYNWQVQQLDSSVNTSSTDSSSGAFTTAIAIGRGGIPDSGATAGYFGVGDARILDYAVTTYYRHVTGRTGSPTIQGLFTGVWKNTSGAIDRVRLSIESTRTFKAGSSLQVYGSGPF